MKCNICSNVVIIPRANVYAAICSLSSPLWLELDRRWSDKTVPVNWLFVYRELRQREVLAKIEILSRFEDLLEEFRGEIRILIRDTIVLSSFLEREAEMALVHQKLICSIPE